MDVRWIFYIVWTVVIFLSVFVSEIDFVIRYTKIKGVYSFITPLAFSIVVSAVWTITYWAILLGAQLAVMIFKGG